MSVLAKAGNFNIGTGAATSTVSVTSVGFQPKVVFFWMVGLTAASNGTRASSHRSFGVATGAGTGWAMGTFDTDAVGTSVTTKTQLEGQCLVESIAGPSFAGSASLQSFAAGGFTLVIDSQFAADYYVSYLALGGDSITNVESGRFTLAGTAPVNQTVNNVANFQPSFTLFASGSAASNPPTSAVDSNLTIGAATGAGDDHVLWSGANDSNSIGGAGSYCLAGEMYAGHPTAPAAASPADRVEFVSHNASPGGFTVNVLERANLTRVLWVSIAGGDWSVGNVLTQTDTVTTFGPSGLASAPAAVMMFSAGKAATTANAVPGTHDQWSIGAATSPTERVVQYADSRDGNTNMFAHIAARSDAIYENTDPAQTAYTEVGRGDVQSFDGSGVTLIMDDADPAQAFAWYVAVGPSAATAARPWGRPFHVNGPRPFRVNRV